MNVSLSSMNSSQQIVPPIIPAKHRQQNPTRRLFIPILTVVLAMTFLTGGAWQVGGDKKVTTMQPTTGQQLTDLHKAKDSGAIADSEYQAQKGRCWKSSTPNRFKNSKVLATVGLSRRRKPRCCPCPQRPSSWPLGPRAKSISTTI